MVKASPLARRLADEAGIDIAQLTGSGPGGRVVKRDVEEAAASGTGAKAEPRPAMMASAQQGVPELEDKQSPVGGMRRAIAQRLSESKFSAPHYYLTATVVADALIDARKQINESAGQKISFNAFLIKFAADTIARHPIVNSTWEGDTIHQHGSVDVGLAVALPDGLITPIVRDCSRKGLLAIEQELQGLIERAKSGKLQSSEYTGATFTISNLGSFGIDQFTAVINPPGSAILAVGRAARQPAIDANDELVIQTQMKLTLSCDHRVIDGAVGAQFLGELKGLLEEPIRPVLAVQV
jgi:pyruvate dehydrogenase E2 component (dihydrolipoamide acetyltransferase)